MAQPANFSGPPERPAQLVGSRHKPVQPSLPRATRARIAKRASDRLRIQQNLPVRPRRYGHRDIAETSTMTSSDYGCVVTIEREGRKFRYRIIDEVSEGTTILDRHAPNGEECRRRATRWIHRRFGEGEPIRFLEVL